MAADDSRSSLGLVEAKALAALASFAFAGAGCWLARVLERGDERREGEGGRSENLLVFCNTLAAGVLLAASQVHMLPDAMKALSGVSAFPLAGAIAGGAFVFLVALGEAAGAMLPERDEPHCDTACATYTASFAVLPRRTLMASHGCDDPMCGGLPFVRSASDGDVVHLCGHVHGDEGGPGACAPKGCHKWRSEPMLHGGADATASPAPGSPYILGALCAPVSQPSPTADSHSCHSHSACCRVHRHSDAPCTTATSEDAGWHTHAHAETVTVDLRQPLLVTSPNKTTPSAGRSSESSHRRRGKASKHDHGAVALCHVRAVGEGPMAEVKSLLLFFALCFHSVMEGLGMGSARDTGLLVGVIVAVLAHKGLAAFALGCSLTQSSLSPRKFWSFVLVFSAGTPLGCAAGALVAGVGDAVAQSVASGVCIALASGTFLQVASMELLPRALADEHRQAAGVSGLVLGYAMMSVLAIWC